MKYEYITVYSVYQAYGGPEEGGWYYDIGSVVKVMPVPKSKAGTLLEKVKTWCGRANKGTRPRESVIGTPDYEARVGSKPGEDYPQERPFYE